MTNVMETYKRWPVTFVRGSGASLYDDRGERYLDLLAGIAVAGVGHAHPTVAGAIAAQARELVHVSNLYWTVPQQRLADELAARTGGMQSFFCNSGAEAIEAALKLARKRGGPDRTRVVCAEGGFHGRTFGALSATGQPGKQEPFRPLVPGFTHVPYGDSRALAGAVADDVCAVLLEPIQGEAGVVVPPEDYLAEARALCDDHGALLVLDEIQTGLGRTGRWFAHQGAGVAPDVMCLAKALAAGLPIGVCLATPEVARSFAPGDHASTFGGGPVTCSAALATLDVIESEGLVERAAQAGASLMEKLDKIASPAGHVRGRGLLVGIEFDDPIASDVVGALFRRNILANDATKNVVRLAPPLVITDDQLDEAVDALRESIDEAV